ncbi:MAG: LPS export ABC transporter periplasmic protein LptC [Acidobacteriia bacterium]|nr:LPS export ABC transporter periplasmic protein LptC [Terriglobia bacterium]
MRNSEAQRYARWSATVAALLALIVAGVYLKNLWLAKQAAKKAPPAVPPSIEQRSNEFSYSKVEGQRTIYTIRASHTTEFKEGSRNLLEDVDIVVYGKKGERNDTLRTRACDFISNTGRISCAGDVQIKLQANEGASGAANAIQVVTSGVSFDRDSGLARTDKPVTFRWPAGEGRAVGVIYDSNAGTLNLVRDVDLSISPSSPAPTANKEITEASLEKNLHLTGNSMEFHRESRTVQVQGDVHAQQLTHEFTADNLLLSLDEAFHAQRLTASGHPQLRETDPQGPITLTADEIASAWRPDGSIASVDASGSVQGARSTPAGNDQVQAGHVRMDLATSQNLLRLMTASNGVTLTSTSAAVTGGTRRVESDALEVHFSSNPRTRQTQVESVNTLAPAHVDWRNVSLVNGKQVPQTMRMSGQQMNLKFGAQNQLQQLASSGGVEVMRKVGDAPEQTTASRELIARFSNAGEWSTIDQTGDVHFRDGQRNAQGDRAHADRAANDVTLDGSVVFADTTTRTTARTATFLQGSNTLRADGNVLTTELSAAAGSISKFAPEPSHVSADHLVADTARGHAVYTGGGRLWQGQSVIQADTIELDSASRTVLARGNVRGVFPEAAWSPAPGQGSLQTHSRTPDKNSSKAGNSAASLGHVWGGLLTYWDQESRARIEQNARVDSEQGSIQANQIDLIFSGSDAASANKQLSRAVATGNVAVRQEDRRGTSNRAEYTASEGKFVLSEGNPTLYSSTGDTTTGRQLTFFFADDRIVVDSADGSKTVTLHRVEK